MVRGPFLLIAQRSVPSEPSSAREVTVYLSLYTHLRAHETDSYLVCRLLLEKKKKTKKNLVCRLLLEKKK